MKNKILKSFLFALLLNTYLFPQWSNDPNNNLIIGYGSDPHICSDSAGGCYITYNAGEPRELFLRRLDKYGYQPWGYKKQILGELPQQWQAEITEDGEGGAIVSYEDLDIYPTPPISRVRVQRVDSSGNFLWGSTGVNVSLDSANQGGQQLVTDGDGGCVITWIKTPFFTYHVNRIDKNGNRMWGDNGIMLGTSAYNSHPRIIRATDGNYYIETGEYIYRIRDNGEIVRRDSVTLGYIVPDPEGGMILSGRVWTGMIPKLVAQRKDSLGNNLWQEPYVEIADSLYINSRLSITNINRNYYYGWTSNKNGIESQPHIQGLRDNGTELFINGGIPLSNISTTITSFIPIIPSDKTSNIYIWTQWINQPSSTGNFAKRIDTTGIQTWGDSAVILNSPALRYLGVTSDCSGGAIGTGYLNEDFAIRVFKISANGKLGEVITSVDSINEDLIIGESILYQNYPNPFNSSTTIQFHLPTESKIKIELYNILGENIKTIVQGFYNKGLHKFKFSSADISSGIYLYKMKTETQSLTKKLIIIK